MRAPANPLLALLALLGACATPAHEPDGVALHYVGSSTIANFMRDAESVYGHARFVLETEPESAGGEAAIREGRCDLAGVAGRPTDSTLALGTRATLLGHDVIAILVHRSNPVAGLTTEQLRAVFTGRITNWSELGGHDLPIHALVVGPESATHNVLRSEILGVEDFAGCETVRPDSAIIDAVRSDVNAIGALSLSFLPVDADITRLTVDGQAARVDNADYAITRPLYLLWWPGRERVAEFVAWSLTPAGRAVVSRRFAP